MKRVSSSRDIVIKRSEKDKLREGYWFWRKIMVAFSENSIYRK